MRIKPLYLPIVLMLPLLGSACSSGSGGSDDANIDNPAILLDEGSEPEVIAPPEVITPVAVPELDNTGDSNDEPDQAPTTVVAPEELPTQEPEQPPAQELDPTPEQEIEEEPVSSGPTAEELGVPTIVDLSDGRVTEFESQLRQIVSAGLIDLNQILQAGEPFSDSQNTCLGAFDPAFGEALTAIDCGDGRLAMDNGEHPVYLHEATFAATTECNAGLLALDTSACQLVSAKITSPVEWVFAEFANLPTPTFSGIAEFNTDPGTLAIFNIPDAPNGVYDCEFNLNDGTVSSGLSFNSCDSNLDSLTARLRIWLERRAAQ